MSEAPYAPPKTRVEDVQQNLTPLTRPKEIDRAIWLVIVSYVMGWIGLAVSWSYYATLQRPLQLLLTQGFGVLVSVWLYYKVYQGRNWARIVLLVLFLFSIVGMLNPIAMQMLAAVPLVSKIGAVIGILINTYIMWLLFFSPGRAWFNRRAAGVPV